MIFLSSEGLTILTVFMVSSQSLKPVTASACELSSEDFYSMPTVSHWSSTWSY